VASIDGTPFVGLLGHPHEVSCAGAGCAERDESEMTSGSPGPPGDTSIGVRLAFELSPFDAVFANTRFILRPAEVPEAGSLGLLATGVVAMARRGRPRR
jgi:hypothetical protein